MASSDDRKIAVRVYEAITNIRTTMRRCEAVLATVAKDEAIRRASADFEDAAIHGDQRARRRCSGTYCTPSVPGGREE
jgi:hypothetical protein